MTIGEKIKEIRNQLGWSQDELAKRAGYNDKTAISKLEHAGNDITLKQVKRIAKAMHVNSAFLMGWSNDLFIGEDNVLVTVTDDKGTSRTTYGIQLSTPEDGLQKRISSYVEFILHNSIAQKLIDEAKKSNDSDIELATEFLMRLNKGNPNNKEDKP